MRTNTSFRSRALASIGIGAVVLSAALPTAAPGQTAGDACRLLSADEIAKLVGQPVGQPSPAEAEEGTACRFSTATDAVLISLWPTDDRAFEDYRGTLSARGAKLELAPEVGDAAYFMDDRLYVRKGTQALTVVIMGGGDGVDARRRETVVAIAKAGLAKLQ